MYNNIERQAILNTKKKERRIQKNIIIFAFTLVCPGTVYLRASGSKKGKTYHHAK